MRYKTDPVGTLRDLIQGLSRHLLARNQIRANRVSNPTEPGYPDEDCRNGDTLDRPSTRQGENPGFSGELV